MHATPDWYWELENWGGQFVEVAIELGARNDDRLPWIGWSAGLTVGWWLDTGDLWIGGPTAYGLIVAFAPHAIASRLRTLLRARDAMPSE